MDPGHKARGDGRGWSGGSDATETALRGWNKQSAVIPALVAGIQFATGERFALLVRRQREPSSADNAETWTPGIKHGVTAVGGGDGGAHATETQSAAGTG